MQWGCRRCRGRAEQTHTASLGTSYPAAPVSTFWSHLEDPPPPFYDVFPPLKTLVAPSAASLGVHWSFSQKQVTEVWTQTWDARNPWAPLAPGEAQPDQHGCLCSRHVKPGDSASSLRPDYGQPWTLLGEKVLSKFEAFIFSPFWNIGWIIRNPPPEVIGFTNIS